VIRYENEGNRSWCLIGFAAFLISLLVSGEIYTA